MRRFAVAYCPSSTPATDGLRSTIASSIVLIISSSSHVWVKLLIKIKKTHKNPRHGGVTISFYAHMGAFPWESATRIFPLFLVGRIFPISHATVRGFVFKIAGYKFFILMHPHEDGTRGEKTSGNQRGRRQAMREARMNEIYWATREGDWRNNGRNMHSLNVINMWYKYAAMIPCNIYAPCLCACLWCVNNGRFIFEMRVDCGKTVDLTLGWRLFLFIGL